MLRNELAHLVDRPQTVQITFALRVAPGEQAMAAQQHAIASRIVSNRLFKLQRELKPGPLPRQPYDLAPELLVELFQLLCHSRLLQ